MIFTNTTTHETIGRGRAPESHRPRNAVRTRAPRIAGDLADRLDPTA